MERRRVRSGATLLWLILLTAAALLLRVWRLGATPLFADEAYYLLWSQHLAPGYYDHPAGVAILLQLSTLLGGANEPGIRWLNALLGAACVPLIYLVGRRYLSDVSGWIGAVAVAFGPVYILTGRIVYPDSLQYFALLLSLLAVYPLLQRDGTVAGWVWFGLTLGLFLNVKGTSLLYLGALAIYALLWRREWFRNPRAWLGAGVALLIFLPWLLWAGQHDWPSLRLAVDQGGGFGMARPGLLSSMAHAWRYLTPPAAILAVIAGSSAVIGVVRLWTSDDPNLSLRRPPAWLFLALSAACILTPMALSAANSPRNLALGLLPLWPLAGLLLPEFHTQTARRTPWILVGLGGWLLIYGIGTVAALLAPTALPHSSGAEAIRKDAAGWPQFGASFDAPEGDLVYAVDYSITGQAAHYTGRPVYSSIGQFRFWGVPDAEDWTVLAQGYAPIELVTERLKEGFASVSDPQTWTYRDADGEKAIYVWRATGRRASTAQLLDELDFLALTRATAP